LNGLRVLGAFALLELMAHLEELFYYLYRRHNINFLAGVGNGPPEEVRGLLRAKAIGVPT
jgi:hypothetical protein